MRFKLKAGQHIQADKTQEPVRVTNQVTGQVTERYPPRVYKQGEIVESDTDLAVKLGAGKFEPVGDWGGPPPPTEVPPSHFPAGQVASGFQQSGSRDDAGRQVSGPISARELAERGLLPGVELPQLQPQAPREQARQPQAQARAPRAGQQPQEPQGQQPNIDNMTLQELKDYAADEEIDLKGATKKEDILKAVKAGQSGAGK